MKYLICIIVAFSPLLVFGQSSSSIDLGAGLGISSYYGDINQDNFFYRPHLSFDGFARYNFNNRFAIRANVMSSAFKAEDVDFKNPYQQKRKASFERKVIEMGIVGEVNFFPYQNPPEWGSSEETIYALLGFSYVNSFSSGKKNITIPGIMFGAGYKRVLSKRLAVEVEWAFRKLLDDKFDKITDPINSGVKSKLFNNDWYNVLGVRLSYNLWEQRGKCRTFDKDTDI